MDIAAGLDAVLELTADNALPADNPEVVIATPTAATASGVSDPAFLLTRWHDSVVTLWTPTTRASGFVVDAKGLVVTSLRAIGAATQVAVQLTPARRSERRVVLQRHQRSTVRS